jgi:hypothetical protein
VPRIRRATRGGLARAFGENTPSIDGILSGPKQDSGGKQDSRGGEGGGPGGAATIPRDGGADTSREQAHRGAVRPAAARAWRSSPAHVGRHPDQRLPSGVRQRSSVRSRPGAPGPRPLAFDQRPGAVSVRPAVRGPGAFDQR